MAIKAHWVVDDFEELHDSTDDTDPDSDVTDEDATDVVIH